MPTELQARDAAQEGRECLFDLLQATQELAADALAASSQGEGTAPPQQTPLPAPGDRGSKSTAGSGCNSANEVQLALLRIDHMHDRGRYWRRVGCAWACQLLQPNAWRWPRGSLTGCWSSCFHLALQALGSVVCFGSQSTPAPLNRRRIVRKWCIELGLGGRLLFRGQLILALLEGPPGDVRECLVRWRTQPVDVDSKGR